MASRPNGHQEGPASRRFRFDDLTSTGVHSPAISPSGASSAHSGRRLVLVAGATILLLWGTLYVVFRDWRARYRARADFGATQVAPVIDALARVTPPGVDELAWRDAVRETHSMLVTVTGANLLDVRQMQSLRRAGAGRRPRTGPSGNGPRRACRGLERHVRPRRVLAPGGDLGTTEGPRSPGHPASTAHQGRSREPGHSEGEPGFSRSSTGPAVSAPDREGRGTDQPSLASPASARDRGPIAS